MAETIHIGDLAIALTRKAVRHVHLTVHPPDGRVTMTAPTTTRLEVARAYAISRLAWIHGKREGLATQPREQPRQYVTRESHYLWGRRYLLRVATIDAKPGVVVDHKRITLQVRPGSTVEQRAAILQAWHRALLRDAAAPLVARWEARLCVRVRACFVQRMKTRWGSCNPLLGHLRLNSELACKPKELLEYVVVHELAHLREPTHGPGFVRLLDETYPRWRTARAELNDLPLAAEAWPA